MEKFRQWTDETEGVNPFVPPWSNASRSYSPAVLLKWVGLALLAVPRLILLFCIALPMLFVLSKLGLGFLFYVPARLALLALGFVEVQKEDADTRRLRIQQLTLGRSYTITISNYQGGIDVLVYAAVYGVNSFCFATTSGYIS